jgi:hypothetical protein
MLVHAGGKLCMVHINASLPHDPHDKTIRAEATVMGPTHEEFLAV